ncbi:histidinolphosphatase [Serendipita sp. 411]|nr:histidinolphosphatase [Serendipita sp. 400]KAG8846823.1 histidinolphosphatase [Serendipita sp. 411]
MVFSHHSHSGQFCRHAVGSLESMVAEAARKGFKMYSLTEHCPRWRDQDLYPEEIEANVTPSDLEATFEAFLSEAQRLKQLYASNGSGMEILVGMETEHIYEKDLSLLKTAIDRNRDKLDFLVGSVHHSDGHPIDFSKERFEEAVQWYTTTTTTTTTSVLNQNQRGGEEEEKVDDSAAAAAALSTLLESYFGAQRRLMEALHPEVIGHFALPLLFTPTTSLASHSTAYALAMGNIRYAIDYGALFELSSAPFRKGWDQGWPGEEVVRMVIEEGGRFCLSDDAHSVGQVGLNYYRLKEWMEKVGVKREMVYRLHKPGDGPLQRIPIEEEDWKQIGNHS